MIREYIAFIDDNPGGTSGITEEELIRCRDCKWKLLNQGKYWICAHEENNAWNIEEDGYCWQGERE